MVRGEGGSGSAALQVRLRGENVNESRGRGCEVHREEGDGVDEGVGDFHPLLSPADAGSSVTLPVEMAPLRFRDKMVLLGHWYTSEVDMSEDKI